VNAQKMDLSSKQKEINNGELMADLKKGGNKSGKPREVKSLLINSKAEQVIPTGNKSTGFWAVCPRLTTVWLTAGVSQSCPNMRAGYLPLHRRSSRPSGQFTFSKLLLVS
jgi:hypothetical protein